MLESADLAKDETNSFIEISSERSHTVSGGFADAWDDATSGDVQNNNNTPIKLHYYRLRVWTSKPCVIYSSQVNNYHLAADHPTGVDTSFEQNNIANNTIKKWQMTAEGGYWSVLSHAWTRRVWSKKKRHHVTVGKPLYLNNAICKWQIKNLDPKDPPSVAQYYGIIEVGIEYDQSSTG